MGLFCLLLQATLLIASFSSKGGSVEIEDCQQQPDTVNYFIEKMGSYLPCLFHKLDIHQSHIYSNLRVAERNSIPDNNGWSHCKHCLWKNGNLFAINAIAHSAVDISWSSWGEFFFADQNDQFKAEVIDSTADILSQSKVVDLFIVRRPVFVLPMITFHVGHIIIDLLEEVYHMMMTEYGEVRTDSLMILDVAGVEERSILQEKIFTNTLNPEHDTFASTLRLLSALPIFSKDVFVELQKQNMHIVFADLHVGIDTSKSFFSRGYEHHPCIFNKAHGEEIRMLSTRYQSFQQFAWRAFSLKAVDPPAQKTPIPVRVPVNMSKAARAENEHEMAMNLLFIDRKNSRVIANSDALLSAATSRLRHGGRGRELQTLAVDLGQLSFTHQLQVLARADIMVAIAGTAVHNILFMRPGSVVVIIMQPGWCKWAWMYANQAVLLDIHPLVHCVPPLPARGDRGRGRGGSDTQALPWNTSFSAGRSGGGQCSSEPDSLDGDDDGTRDIAPGENAFHWARKYWLQGPRFTKGEDVIVDEAAFALLLDRAVMLAQTGSTAATAEEARTGGGGFDGERNAPQPSPPLTCGDHLIVESAGLRHGEQVMRKRGGRGGRGARRPPSVQLFVSSVTSQEVGPNEWKLGIMGEVVWWGDWDARSATPFESLPHLAVCLQSLLTSLDHICFPFSSFNYYAHLYMTITFPVQFVHLWAQAQGRGQGSGSGGKLRGSDAFVVLDTRLGPSAGFHVHRDAVGSVVALGVNKSMYRRLATRYSLQQLSRDLVAQCTKPSSSSSSSRLQLPASVPAHCLEAVAHVTATAHAETLRRALGLPEVQPLPSPARPFVFIHVEKCAGTTLREFIVESAEALGLDYYIPCHGGLHCVTLSIADAPPVHRAALWNVSVVAGHFSWGVWEQLPRWQECVCEQTREKTSGKDVVGGAKKRAVRAHNGEDDGDGRAARDGVRGGTGGPVDSASRPPPCFVMGRHPVDRAISYYYQRCYGVEGCIGHGRHINEITVEELEAIAIYHREAKYKEDDLTLVVLDEGMSETSCRALANAKSTTGLIVGVDEVQVPPSVTEAVTAEALANVQKCVVGILERWNETKTVMKYWFPWIDLVKRDTDRRKMFLYKDKETVATLRADLKQVLLRLNHCDMLIYDKMMSIFNNQLEVVAAVRDAFVPPF